MISSKKITLISLTLTASILIFTVFAMLFPQSQNLKTGTVIYSEKHSLTFTEDDFYSDYAENGIYKISLNGDSVDFSSKNIGFSDNTLTIYGGGTYVLSGKLNDGSIIVNSGDSLPVRLILNGADISSSDFAALYVKQAKKVILSTVKNTENFFSDGSLYNAEKLENTKPSACIYSKDSLTINGSGTLTVTGNFEDAVKVNDTLKITEGKLLVTAKDDGINANDALATLDSEIIITSGGDSVKCENESSDKGFIAINGTSLTLNSGDDAIHSETSVYLSPKAINIENSVEGIEGAFITIDGGIINIVSKDDAINALGENSQKFFMPQRSMGNKAVSDDDIYLTINSGKITLSADGDGIDSNGAIALNGGELYIYGPENSANSSIDTERGFIINGGNLLAAGASGMATNPVSTSSQNSVSVYLDKTFSAGSVISLHDTNGNELITGTCDKNFNWICISTPGISLNNTYTLNINGEKYTDITLTAVNTTVGRKGRGSW